MDKLVWQALEAFFATIKGMCFFMFSKHVEITDSNEEDVLIIFEAVTIFIFHVLLMEA